MKTKMPENENELLESNLEQLLFEINEFCGHNNLKQDDSEIPPALENYLKYVAKSGNTIFPWQHVRPLFRLKMLNAINNFSGEACANEPFVLERFDLFRAAPFTIQRFSELITYPNRHYKLKEKFLRGLEKTVLVVTTVEPTSTEPSSISTESSPEDMHTNAPMSPTMEIVSTQPILPESTPPPLPVVVEPTSSTTEEHLLTISTTESSSEEMNTNTPISPTMEIISNPLILPESAPPSLVVEPTSSEEPPLTVSIESTPEGMNNDAPISPTKEIVSIPLILTEPVAVVAPPPPVEPTSSSTGEEEEPISIENTPEAMNNPPISPPKEIDPTPLILPESSVPSPQPVVEPTSYTEEEEDPSRATESTPESLAFSN